MKHLLAILAICQFVYLDGAEVSEYFTSERTDTTKVEETSAVLSTSSIDGYGTTETSRPDLTLYWATLTTARNSYTEQLLEDDILTKSFSTTVEDNFLTTNINRLKVDVRNEIQVTTDPVHNDNHVTPNDNENIISSKEIMNEIDNTSSKHTSATEDSPTTKSYPAGALTENGDTDRTTPSHEIIDVCSSSSYAIRNVIMKIHERSIYISWLRDKQCGIPYNVQVKPVRFDSKEFPYFRRTVHSFHKIDNLLECAAYNVSIESNNGVLFQKTISMLPGPVRNLKNTIDSNDLTVQWDPPEDSSCVAGYMIRLDDDAPMNITSTTTKYVFPNLESCFIYNIEVSAISNTNEKGKIANITALLREKPGPVTHMTVTISSNTLTVRWDPPEDTSCVTSYKIWLDDSDAIIRPNDTNEYVFKNLEACFTYVVHVAAVSNTGDEGEAVSETVETVVPDFIGPVTNLRLEIIDNNTRLNASWGPPTRQKYCIASYQIVTWNQHDQQIDDSTTDLYITYSPLIGCMLYTVQVKAIHNAAKEGNIQRKEKHAGPLPTNPPTTNSYKVGKRWMEVAVDVDKYTINMCDIEQVTVNCKAPKDENEDYSWIIWEQEGLTNYSDSNQIRPPASVNVTGLSPFTNYTCHAVVINTGGPSSEGEPITFQTNVDVPSAPTNLIVDNITSSGFDIIWDKPEIISGILSNYALNLTAVQSSHYIPEECPLPDQNLFEDLLPEVESYFFNESLPNFEFVVQLTASTEIAGYGHAAEQIVTTRFGVPEAPRDFEHQFDNEFGDTYKVTLKLTWSLPCNTNGNFTNFEVDLHGFQLENHEEDYKSDEIKANDPIENVTYSTDIENIKPLHNYTVTLKAVLEDGTKGESVEISFLSPDGYPSEPTITNVSLEAEAVTITWVEPEFKNGLLLNYKISIQTNGPLHFIPSDCNVNYRDHEEYNVTSEETSFTFNDGLPNFRYFVSIAASTETGFGHNSTTEEFVTLESTPEAPRNFGRTLNTIENIGDAYYVTATLFWKLPCNTNGDLSNFHLEIYGVPVDDQIEYNSSVNVEPNKPIDNISYETVLLDIRPLYNYLVTLRAVLKNGTNGESVEISFSAPDGYPSQPTITNISEGVNNVTIKWDAPKFKNGILQQYRILITTIGPLHILPSDCDISYDEFVYFVTPNETFFTFVEGLPNFNYSVSVAASTILGFGVNSTVEIFQTSESNPDVVRNAKIGVIYLAESEIYWSNVSILFNKTCSLNGVFEYYEINIEYKRNNFRNTTTTRITDIDNTMLNIELLPEHTYTIDIIVSNTNFRSKAAEITPFTSPPGVPPGLADVTAPEPSGKQAAKFTLRSDIFDNSYGDIVYYALILSGKSEESNSTGFGHWAGDSESWPIVGYWVESGPIRPYQTTPKLWNPFETRGSLEYTFIIGEENCTGGEGTICNGPLRPETEYVFIVRGFTTRGFRDSQPVSFITPGDLDESLDLALILGLTFGILTVALLGIFIFIMWRRRQRKGNEKESDVYPLLPCAIPITDFPAHVDDFRDNFNKLKSEFTLLGTKTPENPADTNISVLDENKKKNRYINILPYNDTRVKLDTDKNANYSDYINASYIKGYSGTCEYIATQGPLETTVVDFWRMIMQENVTVIVMVAQFVEQSKQKCHKYFPNKQETMDVGDGIEVRCSNELNFGTYIVRNLLVQKELTQWSIIHLQYIDWPDFGCPRGTQTMLQFSTVMRQHIERNKNKTVIHCSAGVGRTGTLIAIDILLQTIENRGDIDVFKTVFNLRNQRPKMVQTEKQYMYIFNCIRDQILNPVKTEEKNSEPIYENVDLLQATLDERETAESAL